jgi:hypothetical protein
VGMERSCRDERRPSWASWVVVARGTRGGWEVLLTRTRTKKKKRPNGNDCGFVNGVVDCDDRERVL